MLQYVKDKFANIKIRANLMIDLIVQLLDKNSLENLSVWHLFGGRHKIKKKLLLEELCIL
jgi:hypothetical protein